MYIGLNKNNIIKTLIDKMKYRKTANKHELGASIGYSSFRKDRKYGIYLTI